jgi:hypothetical protein
MKPLLPKLKDGAGNKVTNFNLPGLWDTRDQGELDRLSESLEISSIDPENFKIACIPDAWARPLLFDMALFDANHLLHGQILDEWRGFLAMFALKELRNIMRLNVVPVTIPNMKSIPDDTEEFLKALSRLVPMISLSKDTNWNNLYIIMFGPYPIGLTSPTTLVCTSLDYKQYIEGIAWVDDDGSLTDPTTFLNGEEKGKLWGWLDILKNGISNHTGTDRALLGKILKLIGNFQTDLFQGIGNNATTINLSDYGLGMQNGIFQYIEKSIQGEWDENMSHVILKARIPNEKDILIIDKDIPTAWKMNDYDVIVSGGISMAMLDFKNLGVDPTSLGTTSLPDKFRWQMPESFFTDKFYVFPQLNALPGAEIPGKAGTLNLNGKSITPILPIRADILKYLDVKDRISFVPNSSGGIRVTLKLPLTDYKGVIRDFSIVREYGKNDITEIPSTPPVEIWPNFKLAGWSVYYTYISLRAIDNFDIEPYVLGAQPDEQKIDGRCKIAKTKSFPEAIKCMFDGQEAGLILLKQPVELAKTDARWLVGVDFGTTSTNVYVNDYHQAPFPIKFGAKFLQVTDPLAAELSPIFDDFLPYGDYGAPFLSIFHDFLRTMQPPLRPLLDGHIYFLEDYKNFSASTAAVVADLKWSQDPSVRNRTLAFLEQLCLQCSAEAAIKGVSSISWKFSYPTAFSVKDLEDFRNIWHQIVNNCADLTGITMKDAFDQLNVEKEIESIASARYFSVSPEQAPFAAGTVCVDIGGGTSDISIWQSRELKWQTSLRFAGRNLFLDLLLLKPNFLSIFGIDNAVIANLDDIALIKRDKIAFYAQMDSVISEEGQKWLNNLAVFAGTPEVKGFTQLIALGLSGLFYYIGLTLKHLKNANVYKSGMPSIYIAGNGGKLFHWLCPGGFNARSHFNTLFRNMLLKASGFTDTTPFNIRLSRALKSEAAFGLVCENAPLTYNQDNMGDNILAGETFKDGEELLFIVSHEFQPELDQGNIPEALQQEFAGKNITLSISVSIEKIDNTWQIKDDQQKYVIRKEGDQLNIYRENICQENDILTKDRLKAGLTVDQNTSLGIIKPSLPSFNKFIEIFNDYARVTGLVTPITIDDQMNHYVYSDLLDSLTKCTQVHESEIHVEPLFIIELRSLLDRRAQDWANGQLGQMN